ncbi:hypothetical protein ACGC1H_000281 [Rhizoctonia solani]|uniref:F-box domain-containing protein n=1 Tax=Rhizoctonia solani TaxID=456999 RepID=A0A8H3BZT3_9AGAM|nr:unnamed protein product [Rhizoctonia solani]
MDAQPLAVMEELENAGKHFRAALDQYLSVCSRMGDLSSSVLRNIPQKYMHHINAEIAHFSCYESKVKQAEAAVNQTRNRLSQLAPISSLPPEILGRIFQLVAKPCDLTVINSEEPDSETSSSGESEDWNADTDRPSKRRHKPALQLENFPTHLDCLSRVCSYWRQLAINTHSLWTHVDLLPHKLLHKEFFSRADTYVARAGPLPIELHVADINPLAYNEAYLRQFLRLIHNRIDTLNIAVTYEWRQFHTLILDHFFSDHTSASTGLTKLTTSCSLEVDEFINWFEEPHNGFVHLTILHLHGMFPVWGSTAYHNLVDLRFTPASDTRWTRISEPEFRRILEASPRLRILHFALHIVDRQPDDESVPPVQLHDLEAVSISTYRGSEHVILQPGYVLRMLAPGSKPLRLSICHRHHGDNFNDPVPGPEELFKFCQRSNIAKFCARYSRPRLDQLLCFASNLEELALDACVFGWQSDDLLQRSNPATSRLNSLVLHRCSPSLEQLEVLLEQYPTNSLILSGCYWEYIKDSGVRGPVRQIMDLLGKYPSTRFSFQASSPTANWNLIDCT